ncbi:hypothetical protein FQR65_LT13062 [Abscondita terminalis]|nr:hypothetical protein FQR65_LT13062 [Abscondita terminalis]
MVCMPIAAWDAYTMLWSFGEITCKIAKYLQGISVASSVFTITAMSVDRYLAITQPFGFCRWFNKKTTIIVIVLLWITSMVVFAPLLFVGRTHEDAFMDNLTLVFCQESWENFYLTQGVFGIICYIVMFAVPGEECIKEGNVNKELVNALYMNGVFAEDKSLKCFLHCLHLKLKFINDNGVVNIDEIKSQMLPLANDVAKSTVMIEGCAKIKESDGCETAFKMAKCLMAD